MEHRRLTASRLVPLLKCRCSTCSRRYCEVIDELDKTTAEFEALRTCAG
jgi:hypothetical protein